MSSPEAASLRPRVEIGPVPAGVLTGVLAAGALLIAEKRHELKQYADVSLLPYYDDLPRAMAGYEYLNVGGVPIDVFNDPATLVDPVSRTLKASPDFETKLLRSNLTRRDIDLFVYGRKGTPGPAMLAATELQGLKTRLMERAHRRSTADCIPLPVLSVFPFDNKNSLVHSATRLQPDGTITLEQGFASQTLPAEAMQPWQLELPSGTIIPVLDPWEQYWRSMIRFSSGMKRKDEPKLTAMLARLRTTPGLAEQEDGELVQAYRSFYDAMLAGNSRQAFKDALTAPNRSAARVARVAGLAAAREVMAAGQRSKTIAAIVQGLPVIFDQFVGAK